MDIVLFGIQGSGKGTQATMLAARFGYDIFETGAELRRIAATDTEVGRTVKSFIDEGRLAPLPVVMEAVEQAIRSRPAETRIIFDGIPRNEEQRVAFDAVLAATGRTIVAAQIVVDPEVCVQRILQRAAVQGRADDAQEETIRRRMDIFREHTQPAINHYREAGLLAEVDGSGSVDDVYARLVAALRLT